MWKRMLAKICWSRDYVILESTCFSGLRESRHEDSVVYSRVTGGKGGKLGEAATPPRRLRVARKRMRY